MVGHPAVGDSVDTHWPKHPRSTTKEPWNCVLTVPGTEALTFQEWVVRQTDRLGGFCFRYLEETAGPAFLGALYRSIQLPFTLFK